MWAWLLGAFTTFLSSGVARFVAYKVIFTGLVMVTLPIVLNNLIYKLLDISIGVANGYTGGVSSWIGSFTGMTAWLFASLRAPEVLSLILSAMAIRYTLGLIPFVRL